MNPEFWQAFVPAMRARAAARGIPNFHIFGEVAARRHGRPAQLAEHTRVDKLPSVLDFAFAAAVRETVAGNAGTDELARLFADDGLYEGGAAAALRLPTFTGNHDSGVLPDVARRATTQARATTKCCNGCCLAHAMLFLLRGVPVVYYGDEQGFVGQGVDQAARQDMFASQVESYNSQSLLGTATKAAASHFDTGHPLFQTIRTLARLREQQPALRTGRQIVRAAGKAPGLFAVSRRDPDTGREIVIAFNTATTALSALIEVGAASSRFVSLYGDCAAEPLAPGSYAVRLPPLDFVVCAADGAR